ncbi:MAG: N-acetylmuramoyl-L-alanine amidase [Synergistaceae bacterium]|nr:N-acetylmuramoyl-L-alanine amidase [Synergistaceae bacterium]
MHDYNKKLKNIILWGLVLPIFLLAVTINAANASDAYTVFCYAGEDRIGELSANRIDDVYWVTLKSVAELLKMKLSSMGDEVYVSNNNLTVRVVKNASAARIGNRLVSLTEIPREINGSLCLGERSLNALFQRALGKNSNSFVSFRLEYDFSTSSASENNSNNEHILYNGSVVRTERQTKAAPGEKNKPDDTFAQISEIRWSRSQQKIRVVLACVGTKEPILKKETDKITVSSAIFPSGARSEAEDKIQLKEEGSSLIFSGKWKKADIMVLNNPKRIMIEFTFDEGVQQTQSRKEPEEADTSEYKELNIPVSNNIVVLDPGHGGQDPGAVANGVQEKNVNLAIALKLEGALQSKGIQVRLTRRTDVYLKLAERTEMANRLNAEVFVSIHANALPKGRSAKGFEIYLMALPTDNDALELAKFENRELVDGKASSTASDSKTQLLLSILGDMQQNNKIIESTELAEVLYKAGNQSSLPMRRVAQAPFFVLRGAAMPAILLETGFLTDKAEAKLLTQADYQQKIANAMALGIINYMRRK